MVPYDPEKTGLSDWKQSDGLSTRIVVGLFFHLCLRLRQFSFHWIISFGVMRGIGSKWNSSDFSDTDSGQLMIPFTTAIFTLSMALFRLRLWIRLWCKPPWTWQWLYSENQNNSRPHDRTWHCFRPKAVKNYDPNKNISLEKKNKLLIATLCLCDPCQSGRFQANSIATAKLNWITPIWVWRQEREN